MSGLTPCLIYAGFGMAGPPLSQGITFAALSVFLWLALRRRSVLGESRLWLMDWPVWKELLAIGVPVEVGRVVMYSI